MYYLIVIILYIIYYLKSKTLIITGEATPGIALTQKSCIFTQKNAKKCSIKILMRPRTQDVDSLLLLWMLNRLCCWSENFRTKLIKRLEHRGGHIEFNYTKGTGDDLHIRETWMSSLPCLLVVWSVKWPLWTMKREEDIRVFRQIAERVWMAANKRLGRWFIDDL